MKRPLLFVLLVMMVAWFATTRDFRVRNPPRLQPTRLCNFGLPIEPIATRSGPLRRRRTKAHRAIAETRGELREGLDEVNQELHCALQEAAEEAREAVDGIPVPILSGTRVVEALPQPPAPPLCLSVLWLTPLFNPRFRPVHRRTPTPQAFPG